MAHPDSPSFADIIKGLEYNPDGRVVSLESCAEPQYLLTQLFANHLEAVQHIDFSSIPERYIDEFYQKLTARMNTALRHVEGLGRGDAVHVWGNTMALVGRPDGDGFYPEVLSADKRIRGIIDRLNVLQLPDQSGMDLVRLEINSEEAGKVIPKNMTHDFAGLALILRSAELITVDPDATKIEPGAMVLVPIHYRDVKMSREIREIPAV